MEKKLTLQHGGLCQRLVRQYKESTKMVELHLKSLERLNALLTDQLHRFVALIRLFTLQCHTQKY